MYRLNYYRPVELPKQTTQFAIGEWVRKQRKILNWTSQQVASKFEIPLVVWTGFEHGKYDLVEYGFSNDDVIFFFRTNIEEHRKREGS